MTPPLRLAFIADPDSIHVRRWLEAFVRRGHRVHLFVPSGTDPGDLPAGVAVERYVGYGRALRPYGGLRAARSLRRGLAALDPDVTHAHNVTRFGWLGHLSGRHPFVLTAWGSDVLRLASASGLARSLTRRSLGAADLVTAVSATLGQAAVAAGAREDRVRVVQFGVDGARFSPGPPDPALRDRLGLRGRRVVFAPRWIRPLYRQRSVVEALGLLPPDVVVVMTSASADPVTLDAIRASALRLGVEDRLVLLDRIDHREMPAHFRLADVVVSVPESDAFPVTALEAMASARPIVLSALPSAVEGLAGLGASGRLATRLVPVGDVPALATAIGELLELAPASLEAALPDLRRAGLERGEEGANMDRMESYYRALASGDALPG